MSDKALSLPGMEGVLDTLSEAQLKSREARRVFEAQEGVEPWMEDYWRLLGEGWSWRQAVFMLWAAQPADRRLPPTQGELATDVLRLTSDRVIREWKANNPAMASEIAKLVKSVLVKHRPQIFQALVEAASNPNPRAHADRKLALEMLGDYSREQTLRLGQELPEDMSEASEEELRAIALGTPRGKDGDGDS